MTDVVEFLRARLGEDDGPPTGPEHRYGHTDACDWWGDNPGYCTCNGRRRAWREVEAKRAILKEIESRDDFNPEMWGMARLPTRTLLALASVYADHPDYDPEWR